MEIRNTILTFSENNENVLSIYVAIYKELFRNCETYFFKLFPIGGRKSLAQNRQVVYIAF